MSVLVTLASSVLLLASVYGLVNIGFVLLYRTTGVPSFVQGHLVMLGGLIMATAQRFLGGYVLPLLVTVILTAVLGWLLYQVLMRRLSGSEEFIKAIVTFFLATIVVEAAILGWGQEGHHIVQPFDERFVVGSAHISAMIFVTLVLLAALVVLLYIVLDRTVMGIRMQAMAENETLSIYAGIAVHRLSAWAWAGAVSLAAIAGICYSQQVDIDPSVADIGLAALPAAVFGGLNSIPGTLVGGLCFAVLQTAVNYYLGGTTGFLAIYAATLVMLISRPQGLLGSVTGQRI